MTVCDPPPAIIHRSWNPLVSWDALGDLCREAERDGYALLRVVPVTDYQGIAVFERLTPEAVS